MHYIYGKISWINKKNILLETNNVGYRINFNQTDKVIKDKFYRIYIHKNIRIDHKSNVNEEYYGFLTSWEKNLFVDLININGIGCITAINMLNNDTNLLINYICNNDVDNLKNLNGFNQKTAMLVCSTLSERYKTITNITPQQQKISELYSELHFALKKMGYKNEDIKNIEKLEIKDDSDITDLISQSIRIIAEKHEQQV